MNEQFYEQKPNQKVIYNQHIQELREHLDTLEQMDFDKEYDAFINKYTEKANENISLEDVKKSITKLFFDGDEKLKGNIFVALLLDFSCQNTLNNISEWAKLYNKHRNSSDLVPKKEIE